MIDKKKLINDINSQLNKSKNDYYDILLNSDLFDEVIDVEDYVIAIGHFYLTKKLYAQEWEKNLHGKPCGLKIYHYYDDFAYIYKSIGLIFDPLGNILKGLDETYIYNGNEWFYPSTQFISSSDNITIDELIQSNEINLLTAFTERSNTWAELIKFLSGDKSVFTDFINEELSEQEDLIWDLYESLDKSNKVTLDFIKAKTNKHNIEQQFVNKLQASKIISDSIKFQAYKIKEGADAISKSINNLAKSTLEGLEEHADAIRINLKEQ